MSSCIFIDEALKEGIIKIDGSPETVFKEVNGWLEDKKDLTNNEIKQLIKDFANCEYEEYEEYEEYIKNEKKDAAYIHIKDAKDWKGSELNYFIIKDKQLYIIQQDEDVEQENYGINPNSIFGFINSVCKQVTLERKNGRYLTYNEYKKELEDRQLNYLKGVLHRQKEKLEKFCDIITVDQIRYWLGEKRHVFVFDLKSDADYEKIWVVAAYYAVLYAYLQYPSRIDIEELTQLVKEGFPALTEVRKSFCRVDVLLIVDDEKVEGVAYPTCSATNPPMLVGVPDYYVESRSYITMRSVYEQHKERFNNIKRKKKK